VSERHIGPEGERRLADAGFVSEKSRTGKRLWRDPETGRITPGGSALERVERAEVEELERAGWERQEVRRATYWRKPDSGRLYPRGAAYDVHKRGGAS